MLRRLLLNRYVVVFGTIAAVTIAWNLYVVAHRDGRIAASSSDATAGRWPGRSSRCGSAR